MRPEPLRMFLVVTLVFLILFAGTVSAAWSSTIRLTNSASHTSWANNAFDSNGNLHVTYNEWTTPSEVFYMKLDNNGNKLVSEKQITSADGKDSKCPIAAVDSDGNVQVVFCDFRYGTWEPYYVKLNNNGNPSTSEIRLGFSGQDTQPETSPWPTLALDASDNVHVVWTDSPPGNTTPQQRDLYYTKLNKNGNVLVSSKRLTSTASYTVNSAPAIDSNGNVHIVWRDDKDGNFEIYYTKLDNNGNTLVSPKRMTNAAGDARSHPWIVVDSGDNIGIVWPDNRPGNVDLYYMKLNNNGNKLTGDIRLTTDSTDASFAGTVITSTPVDSQDNIHIAWGEKKPSTDTEIYYMKIDNNGNILTGETRLTSTSASEKGGIHMALDPNDYPHITWAANIVGNDEVYYMRELDSTAPDTTITSYPPDPSSSSSATFQFTSTESGTFECRMDGGGYSSCTSPKTYNGLSDGSHTFRVRATDLAGNTDPTPATYSWTVDTTLPVTYYDISLNQEWNLISIPLEQDNWNITSVLAPIEGNYTVVFAYIDDVWEKSTAARDPLTNMSLEYGYWIYMTAPDTLELSGTVPATTTINIVAPGWNLAGYPSFTTRNITDVLSSINYSVVFAYIDDVWEKSTAARDPLTEMATGFGYWIYANEAGSYDVTN